MATIALAALAAADLIDDLLDDLSDEEARTIWKWSGYGEEYPRNRVARRAELRKIAQREGWRIEVRKARSLRSLMLRAIITRDIRGLRLLLLLIVVQCAAFAARLRGRDDRVMPRAGHGAAAPVRGSPFGRFALAPPGAPPD